MVRRIVIFKKDKKKKKNSTYLLFPAPVLGLSPARLGIAAPRQKMHGLPPRRK
jgi:hypothetical protein